MAETPASIVSDYLQRVAAEEPGDAELLARFTASKDGEAFALLVRRHGPMVLGVCRRAAGDSADDAFQATFLALARQAGRVKERLPGWLHRVATRTARRTVLRSGPSLRETSDKSDPFVAVEWRDLRAALDVELAALPKRLSTPLVLCYLDGLTRDEAAARLGCSLRTLHRRLDEGRRRLRDRLTRRGLAPVLLGAAALSVDGLRAAVPADLSQSVIEQATDAMTIAPAVQQLLPSATGIQGVVMKTLVALAVIAGGITAVVAVRQPATADTVPPAVAADLVRRPLPKDPPVPDAFAQSVNKTRLAAITWLVKEQNEDGSWGKDAATNAQPGGATALALVALLENGLKADDVAAKLGLQALRSIKPQHTYVVSLQTQAFCLAKQKEDAERIRANVKWLEKALNRDEAGKPVGWSYGNAQGQRGDNSNTRYAVSGLYAAHKAGFKVEHMVLWEELRAMFLRMQFSAGGWGYTASGAQATQTMTCSALLCLAQIEDVLGKRHDMVAAAVKKGFAWLDSNLNLTGATYTYYFLDVLSQMNSITHREKFGGGKETLDWKRAGTAWLIEHQRPSGRFESDAPLNSPVLSTAFALRFLRARD